MAIRINKYLSEAGYCSRREADKLILEGKVTINGKIPEIGTKVEDSDEVEVKRFTRNDKSIDGVFEYMFIDTGKIVGGLGQKPPLMTNTVSVEIDLAREIYERLLSKGWRKIEKVWT